MSEKDGYVAVGAVAIFKSISGILFGNDMAAADACFCKALVSTTDKIQISEIITPIVKRYSLPAVYLFVSYARGIANDTSDIDLLVDTAGTKLKSLMSLGALCCELEEALQKSIDLITVSSLQQSARMPSEEDFGNAVMKEPIMLYSVAAAPDK